MSARLGDGINIRKDRPKGTMIVKRIINLTNIDLTFYDQFGSLITLHPEQLKLQHGGKLPIIGDSTYIAVDESVDKELLSKIEADDDYKSRMVTPHSIGKIRDNKEGYHFIATGRSGRKFFVITSSGAKISQRL
ncbi:hypothetical protein IJG93_00195 [Candidatus Saccharibacteria bacterium]|nr:hypothetical protein [Candidatus Saccharibacteria bacterium]